MSEVFLGNISYGATIQEIHSFVSSLYPSLKSIDMPVPDKKNSSDFMSLLLGVVERNRGYAFLRFGENEEARRIIADCNRGKLLFQGRELKANWSKKRSAGSASSSTEFTGRVKFNCYKVRLGYRVAVDQDEKVFYGEDGFANVSLSIVFDEQLFRLELQKGLFLDIHLQHIKVERFESGFVFVLENLPMISQETRFFSVYQYGDILKRLSSDEIQGEISLESVNSILVYMHPDAFEKFMSHKYFVRHFAEPPFFYMTEKRMPYFKLEQEVRNFSDEVFYRLEMISTCDLISKNDFPDFIQFLKEELNAAENESDVTYILDEMWDPTRTECYANPIDMFLQRRQYLQRPDITDPNYAFIKKAVVTPLKIYFLRPVLETTNNAVRSWDSDRFIRVNLCEEDFRNPFAMHTSEKENIVNRFKKVLDEGIQIGKRRYLFLGYSSSQLKDGDCWFYCPANNTTIEGIISSFGDFSEIDIVGKYAARVGQKFSNTKHGYTLLPNQIEEIPDIKTYDKRYTFSDGSGCISPELASILWRKLGYSDHPTAFQIRLGGCKGVLSLNPNLSGIKVQVRPSMKKFLSDDTKLEICSPARPIPGYLNRHIILILSFLGVPNTVFLYKMLEIIQDLDLMFTSNEVASNIVIKYGMSNLWLLDLLSAGFDTSEPCVEAQLNLIRYKTLRDIKYKARIPVENSRNLMGVMDETHLLNYGEVFIQYSEYNSDVEDTRILETDVVIVKNPCLHPGDIRRFKAVNIPELSHLKNVVVFPSKGKRPHPSECSGGDLDGDLYFVTWDQELIFNENYTPGDYIPPEPVRVQGRITQEHVTSFIIDFMQNNNLGYLCTIHLAIADKEGIDHYKCLQLHQLATTAVDFPKSGVKAVLPRDLSKNLSYPNYMEKPKEISFESRSVLGKLYNEFKSDLSQNSVDPTRDKEIDPDLIYPGFEDYLDFANEQKESWNTAISSIMTQYGLKYEAELLTGIALSSHKFNNNDRKTWNTKSSFTEQLNLTKKEYLRAFKKNLKGDTSIESKKAQASAYYFATYSDHESKLMSFPWVIASRYLIKIKNQS
eukprot:TRINITY_DN12837_c0_g1_i1.p1 TRINITY_DN12837_c0_g1~~TRINITY_DN12837_c0_g1_i1.p1  ORF type:complete len:1060 (+),score=194.76 TRINITY_DN12837_c0_g1_i1:118-3297(+)